MARRYRADLVLPRLFLRQCRRSRFRHKVADSTGVRLSGGSLLMRTLILRRLLLRDVLSDDERFVGVLLPPSAGAVVANAVLPLCGRIAVNLNYTMTVDILNHCIREAGIRHVLTSRKFLERVPLAGLEAELVVLENLREQVTWRDKLLAAWQAQVTPLAILERRLGLTKIRRDDLITVIFTSGSTGMPKGVMLSYDNIGTNVEAINEVVRIVPQDVMLGVLPFFHSFGYTVTLWAVLALEMRGAYHYSPLDAKQIGKLCREEGVTILVSTPTFLRGYLRRCDKADLASVNVIVAGAEKLPIDLCEAFEKQFGVRPVEGYGTTELSPLVSVNIPPGREPAGETGGLREGTVGRPVPGVSAKVIDPESEQDLGVEREGMLLIKGPNVMRGYLGQPEKTAEVMRDGWYVTGDMARLHADGFIEITGRLSRFSKIGGEMVPHLKIEELLQQIVSPDEQKLCIAVSAVPDERKGERLVVLHTPLEQKPEDICKRLAAQGVPNLWLPAPDSFCEVEEIPLLGTGKLDLQALKRLALERFSAASAGR